MSPVSGKARLAELVDERSIGIILKRKVEDYFANEDNRRAFEEWFRAKHGKEYQWK